jgi:hypothetical protein
MTNQEDMVGEIVSMIKEKTIVPASVARSEYQETRVMKQLALEIIAHVSAVEAVVGGVSRMIDAPEIYRVALRSTNAPPEWSHEYALNVVVGAVYEDAKKVKVSGGKDKK